ncbi:MAG: MATE family efflux transporter [Muribaculaceae bacterium]|nr:MATE family efflux transporter [Muribaculaceae bacterium]
MNKANSSNINMLSGPLFGPMIAFAMPLIASGVLQQSFNSVDIAIAGRFAGHNALAAVGSNGPVIGLLINMFMGLAVGTNVVIANYIGQRNRRGTGTAAGASVFLGAVCGLVLLCITQLLARPLLTALGTPAEVLDDAVSYLRIYALGMPFMLVYNFGAAILRSYGDTRRPFYSLVISGFINLFLNILFVIGLDMGVQGVAWGTVFANLANSVYIIYVLLREKGDAHLDPSTIRPNREELAKIARIGIPAGLQSTVFSISNVFILSSINSFGALAAAGSAAAINFELYSYFIIVAFVQTAVAFTSQNYGAGNYDRCRRVFRISLALAVLTGIVFSAIVAWQDKFFIGIFVSEPTVTQFAAIRISTVLLFQCIACYYEVTSACMRGMGHSLAPALIVVFGTCVLRLVWVGFFPAGASFAQLLAVYPISWTLTDIAIFIAFRRILARLPQKQPVPVPKNAFCE